MDDLISEFLTETAESLDVIDAELVRFENNPDDRAILDNIFRLLHTVKGTCGFLGLPRLEAVAHAGETLLGKFRDGELAVTPPMVTLVLESIDRIKMILTALEATGVEPAGEDHELIGRLEDAAMGRMVEAAPAAPAAPAAQEPEAPADDTPEGWDADLGRELRPGEVSLADLEAAFQSAEAEMPGGTEASPAEEQEHLGVGDFDPDLGRELRPGEVSAAELEAAFAAADAEVPAGVADPVITEDMSQEEALQTAVAELSGNGAAGMDGGPRVQQTVRVGVDVLEALMTTVSELVLTRNQLMQTIRGLEDDEGRLRAGLQFAQQIFFENDLGNAAVRKAADETGPTDIGVVDPEAKTRRQQHAERCENPENAGLLVGGFQNDHGKPDVFPVGRSDVLDQRALVTGGTGRRVAAHLPVAVSRADLALCRGGQISVSQRTEDDPGNGREFGKRQSGTSVRAGSQ